MLSSTKQYLHDLGYSDKETDVFLTIYQYGPKPASTVAKLSNTERTYCYKVIEKLLTDNLIQQTTEQKTKLFFVSNPDVLADCLTHRMQGLKQLQLSYDQVAQELTFLKLNQKARTPKVVIFDGGDALTRVYQDIIGTAKQKQLLAITMFMPQTFATIASSQTEYQTLFQGFLDQTTSTGVHVHGVLGQGVLLMEQVIATTDPIQLRTITIGENTTQGFLVGDTLYMVQYRQLPLAIKITSTDLAEMMRFLFEHIQK